VSRVAWTGKKTELTKEGSGPHWIGQGEKRSFQASASFLTRLLQSSLTLSLLRCIFTEGTVYYDGIPTSSINLDALRSNITIIPQVVRYFPLLARS
jgi:hypothetical protein